MTHYLNRAFLIVACFSGILHAEPLPSHRFYKELGSLVLKAEEQLPTRDKGDENISAAQKNAPINISITIGSRADQLKEWFSLLGKLMPQLPQDRFLSYDVIEKLNIVSGTASNKKLSIIGTMPLITTIGTASTAEIISLSNNTQSHQEIIQYFTQNPEILRATQQALDKIEAGTGMYLTFMEQQNEATKAAFNTLFFDGNFKFLNKSMAAFIALHGFKNLMFLWQNTPPNSGFLALINYFEAYQESGDSSYLQQAKLYTIDTPLQIGKDIFETQIAKHSFQKTSADLQADLSNLFSSVQDMSPLDIAKNYAKILKSTARGSLGDSIALYKTILSPSLATTLACASQAITDVMYAYSIYTALQRANFENTIFENMQIRLMGIAKITEGLAELDSIAQASQLTSLQELAEEIKQLLAHTQETSEIGSLINNLLTRTFKGDSSYWSNRPRILVTYHAMQEHKEVFVPALHAAGMVDALQSAAQLYLDHQNSPARYSFVNFVSDDLPIVQLADFWNPLMSAEKAVCNSVHLGNGGDKNMLLTGPNGSGKSVNMKAIALNIILAQAFGIAAAGQAIITPFTTIEVYMNEQEDLSAELSSFMAQAKKLDNLCKSVRNLKPNQKSIMFIDEPLNGTVEDAGALKVYEAGLALAQQDENICVMATHFLKPTDLENETMRGFVNYHVELLEPQLGEFIRTFTLVPGANLWWFGKHETDSAKRTRFISWLTKLQN